jgi:hypothetical protein
VALNLQNLRTWIRHKLGEPIVCVELDEPPVDHAVNDAFLWWSSYRGLYFQDTITVAVGTHQYDLSAHVPEVIDVTKVWFTIDRAIDLSNTWNGFLDIQGYPYDHHVSQQVSTGFYSGLLQWLQMRDTAARILSVDVDWFFDQQSKILTITPEPNVAGTAVYLYRAKFTEDQLSLIAPEEQWLIRERALAETKYMLGRVRGKYTGGLPAAQGNVSLDGADLIREAQEDFERIETKLLQVIPPPNMLVG